MTYPNLDSLTNQISVLIFDLDGTLLDSMSAWNDVDIKFLSDRGFEVTEEYTNVVKNCCIRDAADYTVKTFGLSETPDQVIDTWNSMIKEAYSSKIPLKPGASDYLRKARQMGFKITAATALGRELAELCLKNNEVFDLFDTVITLDDIGSRADKSDPAIYRLAMNKAGEALESNCLVFEDVLVALKGAKSGGFKVCSVYDSIGSGKKQWEEMQEISDYSLLKWQNC